MTAVLDHPSLGAKIRGVVDDGVTRYFGIKYATLEHKFDAPHPVDRSTTADVIDATKAG